MRYLRAFYSNAQFCGKNFDRLEFAPVTIFCGCSEDERSNLLNFISQNIFNKYLDYYNYWEFREAMDDIPEDTDVWDYDSEGYQQFEIFDTQWQHFNSEIHDKHGYMYDSFHTGKIHAVFETDEEGMDILPSKILVKRANDYLTDKYESDITISACICSELNDFESYDICFLDSLDTGLSIDDEIKLAEYIEECAYKYKVQFIIMTSSPVIAKIKDALIYDIDSDYITEKQWCDVSLVKKYKQILGE